MNRVTPEAYIPYIHQAQQERTKSPSVEIGNARITRGDIIDITNKKGDMVRYTVTDIKIGDGSPDRLLLQSLDSNRRTFKDIKTLAKSPDMFHVLTQKERERAAEAEITALQNKAALRQTAEGLTDEVIDQVFDDMREKPDRDTLTETVPTPLSVVEDEINNSVSILKKEADSIDTLRETIARMLTPEQRAQVQAYAEKTKQTSILKHRGGARFLWNEMQADIQKYAQTLHSEIDTAFETIQTPSKYPDHDHLRISPADITATKERLSTEGRTLRRGALPGEHSLTQMQQTYGGDVTRVRIVPTPETTAQKPETLTDTQTAEMIEEVDTSLRKAGFREMTPADLQALDFVDERRDDMSTATTVPDTQHITTLSEAQRIEMAEKEIAAIRALYKPSEPTPSEMRAVVDEKATTAYSTGSDAKPQAQQLDENQSKVSPDIFSTRPAADQTVRDAQTQTTTPSLFGKIASGIRNFFGRKPELPTGASPTRITYTEHAPPVTRSTFTPPSGFETPTLQSIKETISGTRRTLYETDSEMIAQAKRDANKAAEQTTQKTKRPTIIDAGYADRYAAYKKNRNTAPAPSFFGNIRKLFGRQPEVQTGAPLSRTVYKPDAVPKNPLPDNVISFPKPKERKPRDTDSNMFEAAE